MTQRDRLMLTALGAVALILGYWFLLLTPKRDAAAEAESQVAAARQALTEAQQKLTSGQEAQKRFRRDRTMVVRLGRVLPPSDDTPTVLTQLDSIARKHRITFKSFAIEAGGGAGTTTDGAAPAADPDAPVAPLYPPGTEQMSGGLGRTPLKVELEGTYFDLERFVRAVQRFAVVSADGEQAKARGRLFVIDGINYKVAEGESDDAKGKLHAELFASTYFAPEIQAPGAGGTPADPNAGATPGATPTTGTAAIGGLR